MSIITYYDQTRFVLLKEKSKLVEFPLGEDELNIIVEAKKIMSEDMNCFGLHAIQLGLPRQLFVMMVHNKPKTFINTEILWKSRETKKDVESCMSLPGYSVRIPRPRSIRLKYKDECGKEFQEEFSGTNARCILHEWDHQNGILLTDYV